MTVLVVEDEVESGDRLVVIVSTTSEVVPKSVDVVLNSAVEDGVVDVAVNVVVVVRGTQQ